MLASFPVSMLNQKPSDLGIPNRFKLDPSRSSALPAHLVRFERFADCRHAVIPDAPEQGIALIREFIERR
jgi:hypothetical protein